MFFLERILPDPHHWETVVPKVTKVWRTCVLPELVSRWYTRKQPIVNVVSAKDHRGICYCNKHSKESSVHCSNPKCLISEFHYSCLQISDPIPKVWYCPTCRVLTEFQKQKKEEKAQYFQECSTKF